MEEELKNMMTITEGNLSIMEFVVNLLITAILSIVLKLVYQKYGNSLSNRKQFGGNFLIMAMTTMLIITVVKSSLALSLGLVGALSVIRFRSAIKEPEELGYLFLAISIGLGMGANQIMITIVAFIVIAIIIILVSLFSGKFQKNQNLHISVQSNDPQNISVKQILIVLEKHCDEVNLRRFDETLNDIDASFLVQAKDFDQIDKVKSELQMIQNDIKLTFLDNKGIIS
jgi:hypothetical protein